MFNCSRPNCEGHLMVWPLRDRKDQLARLVVGDIFHAKPSSPEGASLICLVVSVTESTIHARTVTHQMQTEFDRQTGEGVWGDDRIPCTIDSTAPLPVEIHNVMLGLDRKIGWSDFRNGSNRTTPRFKLSCFWMRITHLIHCELHRLRRKRNCHNSFLVSVKIHGNM